MSEITEQSAARSGSVGRYVRFFLRSMITLYALGAILILAMRYYPGERFRVIAIVNTFLYVLFVPALLLFPFSLLMRYWRETILLLPILVSCFLNYGRLFMSPSVPDVPHSAVALHVMTYNTLGRRTDFDRTVKILRDSNADLITLPEVNFYLAQAIQSELSEQYPYMALHPGGSENIGWTGGQGVLSRYPLRENSYWDYPQSRLGNQRVIVDVDGRSFVLYSAHPVHPILSRRNYFDISLRKQHTEDILARIAHEQLPVLLMGDFNMSDTSQIYLTIRRQGFYDAWREVGYGMGFTYEATSQRFPPLLRLDYIFHDRHFIATEAQVMPDGGGSDHLPVKATLQFVS